MAWFGIEHQNLGAFLENKVHWKSKLSKYGINKSLSPIFVFFNKKISCDLAWFGNECQNLGAFLENKVH